MPKYYVVHQGHNPGIYGTWEECRRQVEGFDGAQFKKFDNMFEAEKFLKNGFGRTIVSKSKVVKQKTEEKNDRIYQEMIDSDKPKIYIYTDGSLIRQGKNVKCGYGFYIPSKNIRVAKPYYGDKITNNRAEMTAILESIENISEEEKNVTKLVIFTDSQYCIYLFNGTGERYERNHWKNDRNEEVPNIELIQQLLLYKRSYDIVLCKIEAHTNLQDEHSIGNSIADRLANEGASQYREKSKSNASPLEKRFEENEMERKVRRYQQTEEEYSRKILQEVEDRERNIYKTKTVSKTVSSTQEEIEHRRNVKLKNSNIQSWFLEDND
jgi:ribonuclease HI